MKKTIVFLLIILLLILPSCKKESETTLPTATTPIPVSEPSDSVPPDLKVSLFTESDDSKRLYIETEYFNPFIYPEDSVERKLADAVHAQMDEMIEWIKNEARRFPATDENMISYGLYSFISITEESDDLISLYVDYSMYTGGAHGNWKRVSYIYDRNGTDISAFEDILAPGYTMSNIEAEVNRQMSEIVEEQGPMFYEETVEFDDLYFPPSFYIEDNEIIVYFQTYEIAPFAAGIPEFSMPRAYMKTFD